MSVKAFNKEKDSFVKIASLQSRDIVVDKNEFVSDNVSDALSELKRELKAMQSNIAWIYNNGTIGGGGSGSGSDYTGIIQVENFNSEHNLVLQETEAVTVMLKVVSKLNSAFSVTITIGALSKTVSVMPNVTTPIPMGQVAQGTHEVVISGEDYTGYPMETWRGHVIKGLLSIETQFNSDYEYEMTQAVVMRYRVNLSSAVSHRPLTVSYTLDGGEEIPLNDVKPNVFSDIVINSGNEQMKMGQHKVTIIAKIPDISGLDYITATREIPFLVYDKNHISIYIPNTTSNSYIIENTIAIPFGIISHNSYRSFLVNWEIHEGETLGVAKQSGSGVYVRGLDMSIILDATTANGYQVGKYTLRMWGTVDGQMVPSVEDCIFTFELKEQITQITPWTEVDGAIASFNARTQTSLGANNEWNNNVANNIYGIKCNIINPMETPFVHNATITDPKENDLLQLFGESYAFIDFNPFAKGLTSTGFSIEIVYRCSSNGDYNAVVASCGEYSVGTRVSLTEGFCVDANNVNTKYASANTDAPLMEDEWIHCTIVYEPVANATTPTLFSKVYLNGVLSAAINSDVKISTANPEKWKGIYLGARYYWVAEGGEEVEHIDKFSDVEFKTVRLYDRALTQQEVAKNYIADDYYMYRDEMGYYDSTRNLKLRNASAFDNNGNFDVSNSNLPRVYVWFDSVDITNRFVQITESTVRNDELLEEIACNIRYENKPGSVNEQVRFDTRQWNLAGTGKSQINRPFIKVQGTTSLTYNHKNYDISFGTWADSSKEVLFSPKWGIPGKQWLPENTFTLKADLIDSSHANNVGTAKAITAISEEAGLRTAIPPMIQGNNLNNQDIKFAIDGFPCLLYVYDNAKGDYFNVDQPGTPTLYGVYMFDLGRTSYNNMGMQNLQVNEMDVAQGAIGCVATDYELKLNETDKTQLYHRENTLVYEGSANSTKGSSINFQTTDASVIAREWEQQYPIGDVPGAIDTFQKAFVNVYNWDLGGRDAFMQDAVWHQQACITYLICGYVFGMVDNLGKNMQVKTWDGKQWFPMFYDLDTVLGLDNTGGIYYGSNVDLDKYGENQNEYQIISRNETEDATYELSYGSGLGKDGGLYNTSGSKLWNAVRDLDVWYGKPVTSGSGFEPASFRYMYNHLRTDKKLLTYGKLYEFYSSIMDEIGITFYNIDAETKYLDFYTRNDANSGVEVTGYNNIGMMHGTRELLTKRWLRDRLIYLDSLFEVYVGTPHGDVTLQTRNTWESGSYTVGVKTKCPVFVRQTQDSNDVDASKIALCDRFYVTNYTLNKQGVSNRQFTYNNADLITDLRGVNSTQLMEMQISTAASLLNLNISNSTSLKTLTLEGLNSLRYLDCSYCPFAGSEASTSLNLSKSLSLQEVNISYSGITSMGLPVGGTLKKINASNTRLSDIKVIAQTMLEELDLSNCNDLSSIELTKCDSLKKITITNSALTVIKITYCPSLEEIILRGNTRLSKVSFVGCENIKIIDLSDCTLSTFATYTGNEDIDETTALDLSGCPNLEDLCLTNCSAQVIKLSANCSSLKNIAANNSKWMQTIIVSGELMHFSTWSDGSDVYPAIDLERQKSLELITFQSNARVQAITNLTYAGKGNHAFRYCSALRRITGHITLDNSSDYMFANMSSVFRLNGNYGNRPSYETAATLTLPLKISIAEGTTKLNHTFDYNRGITLYDVCYVCALIPSTVTECVETFYRTALQSQEYTAESLPSNLLKGATGLKVTSGMFSSANLKNLFPSAILNYSQQLTNISSMFSYNAFNTLDSTFSSTVLKGLERLTTCNAFLANNMSLKNQSSEPVQLSELFKDNTELTNCALFLGVNNKASGYEYSDDAYLDAVNRRALYINFGTTGDELFANNSKLTDCHNAFAKCTAQGVMSDNIFGGVNNTGNYPTGLENVEFCFHDCNVTTVLTDKLFSNQPNLKKVSGFVSGGITGSTSNLCRNVTGDIATLGTLFTSNPLLTEVRRFFESTGVTGQIPEGTSIAASPLFAKNVLLQRADRLFANADNITGRVPATLFGNCPNLSSCESLFRSCSGITDVLPGAGTDTSLQLFKCLTSETGAFTSLSNVAHLFDGCTGIYSQIPANLFVNTPGVTNASYVFRDCGTQASTTKGLYGEIPSTLLDSMPLLSDVSYMFSGCWNLGQTVISSGAKYSLPVDDAGRSLLFKNNKQLQNVAGLLQKTIVNNIPSDLFTGCTLINDVSYMFNLADRSNAIIPPVLFDYCPNISTIRCFAGESGGTYQASYSLTTFPDAIFKPWDGQIGQKNIEDVFCAFRNNPNTDGGNAILFYNWSVAPKTFAGCYHMCNELYNYDSIDPGYKTSA